jgi:hypothetical protein
MLGKQLQDGFTKSDLVLHTGFLFWPVNSLRECAGWLCGTYVRLESLDYPELLTKGRLARRHHRTALKGEEVADIEITDSEVDHSYLWHENLAAALEAERVLYETYQLDEQRYCDPQALVYGDKAEAALMEFTNLDTGNTQQAAGFIEKYGAFDSLELSVDGLVLPSLPWEVQQFCNDCLRPKNPRERREPFAIPLDQFWETHKDILGLWKFANALSARKEHAVREECERRRPTFEFRGETDWLAVGKAVLSADLSASLNSSAFRPPRLLLHDRDGQFLALTLCRTVRSALYVQLLTAIVSQKEHRRCLRCRGYFIPKVQSQKYCKGKCQNIAKVRRSRDKRNKQEALTGQPNAHSG